MKHLVYKIINQVNDKIYIGKHSTDNVDDEYFGSGSAIINAINKYGLDNFKKEILKTFENELDAYLYEAEIVTDDFVKSRNTYNLTTGGKGFQIGHPTTSEVRAKISATLTGRPTGKKGIFKHTDETKEHLRKQSTKFYTSFKYFRACPECGNLLYYAQARNCRNSLNNKTLCGSCGSKNRKNLHSPLSEETKKRISRSKKKFWSSFKYFRACPKCGEVKYYTQKTLCERAVRNNGLCYTCIGRLDTKLNSMQKHT